MDVVVAAVAAMLSAAALMTVLRLVRGPSLLDRLVATDMLLAVVVAGLAVLAASSRDSSVVPVIVVVSLLGFIGSVSVAQLLMRERE